MENVEDIYALAPLQEGLVFHTISDPASGVFVDQVSAVLAGDLDPAAFRQAWTTAVARHAALRTCFLWDGLDEPLQVVREHVAIPWAEEDWRGLDAPLVEQRLATLLRDDRRRGFDLSAAPLLRMTLACLTPRTWRWVWTFHHLIADGWSTAIILRQVFATYAAVRRGADPGLDPPFRYRDYIGWHAQRDLEPAEAYWRRELRGFTAPTRLNVQHPPPAGDALGRQRRRVLTPDTTRSLSSLASAQRVTLNTVVQGAWSLLLSRYAHDDDVVFGVTTAGRPPELPGVEDAVGLFINTLPLRPRIDPDAPLSDWLRALQKKQFEIREWEFTPLAAVQRWSEVPAGQPLFESILVFENYPAAGALSGGSGIELRDLDIFEQSNYPLALLAVPAECLELIAVYDANRFGDALMTRMLDHLAVLLQAFVDAPQRPLREFALLTDAERQQLLAAWNDTRADQPRAACIHDLIEATAGTHPDALAVVSADAELTYRQLDRRANCVAHGLRAIGVGPDTCVGLYIDRCADMVVGILGILKAGGAYVPLDIDYPIEQLRFIVADADLSVVLTGQTLLESLPDSRARVIAVDALAASTDGPGDLPPPRQSGRDHLAYVIYTSGSTGKPKGVMVTHRNLVHATAARIDHYPGAVGRFLLLSSFAFDSSVAGIFWSLCTGGALVLPARRLEQDMARLAALMSERRVTHLLCLPALYGLILAHGRGAHLGALKLAIVAGEACPATVAAQHLTRLPQTPLYNEYGPTEGTVWSTVHRVRSDDLHGPVPIGRPIANTGVYLLDQHRHAVPVGICGELYLAGPGLARGYRNSPELTAQHFVSLCVDHQPVRRLYRTGDLACYRDDGRLLFLGRVDAQVKVRGYRIELGGIEATLVGHPAVREAAVTLRDSPGGVQRKRLAAYLVCGAAAGHAALSRSREDEIRAYLRQRLPDYMLPDYLIAVAALPRLPNGKIDYRSLPEPVVEVQYGGSAYRAPSTGAERTLAAIWAELLGLERVGVDDNFFEVGGDSIISIQVISRARQAGLNIEPKHMASYPTVGELAQAVDFAAPASGPAEPVAGEAPVTPAQAWFLELPLSAPQHWNQSALFELPADVDGDALAGALGHCVRYHDALRTRFERHGHRWRQRVPPPDAAPLPLETVDLAATGRPQQERVLDQRVAAAQAGLDLASGPVLRAVLFRRGPDQPALLLIAIHHLVVDMVSWRILTEDLAAAYGLLRAGQPVELPPKTTSYLRWAQQLVELADTPARRAELAYWQQSPERGSDTLPVDFAERGIATEATAATLTVELDAERTGLLLTEAHVAYQTRAEELLVTALLLGINRWTGQTGLRLGMEGHGRADDLPGVDVSRTIGWFTAVYPVNLKLELNQDPGATIKSVKEQLRAVPGGGLGYGMLRYLNTDPAIAAVLAAQPRPEILFNYLSRVRRDSGAGLLRRVSGVEASSRDPQSVRPCLLEINAAVDADRLRMDFIYNRIRHRDETVRTLARHVIDALAGLVDHCRSPDAGGYTPSDFPDAELSQEELDRLLDGIG